MVYNHFMNELRLDNVYLNYFGHRDSIIGFSHTFSDGLNILYGENGSGKTSLLKLIAGINSPTNGEILLNGKPIDYKKDIQMVFDDLALFERRSVKYNLNYPLKLRKISKDTINELVEYGMEYYSLSKVLLTSKVFRLKQIDRVRLALIRVTYRNTPILLLDNPLSALSDDERKRMFLKLLGYLSARKGIIIYATDKAEEVALINTRTTVISYGYKQDCGLSHDLTTTPHCLFTAQGLIPYFNTFKGEIKQGKLHFDLAELELNLDGSLAKEYEGKEVIVGIPFHGLKGRLFDDMSYSLCYGDFKIDVYRRKGCDLFVQACDCDFVIDKSKVLLFDVQSERLIYPTID